MRSIRNSVAVHRLMALCLIMVLLISLGGIASAWSPASAGPLEIQVTERDSGRAVDLKGEVLVLNLESNPSTGYGWQVQGLDTRILRQVGASEWLPDTPGKLGGSGTEVLRLAAVGKGRAKLNLVYARPWEAAAKPAKSFSLEVNVAEPSRNVTYPQPAVQEPLAAAGDGASLEALPSSYNWCDQGGCTPVRDQGQCGSCWAFGTVGPLESAILIQDGLSKDLAEQYLVSCNTDGWGCDGGWWAHDYHEWKVPPGEPGPGAVYEADFPYTATDAPCNGPHTHHETIADWVFVGGESSVPSTAAIKQAILDHGPVSAALCVNNTFKAYTGGVFEPTGWCLTINHAITLVGWDDSLGSQGAWRLRNSWGDDWGEDGYMWIAYGKYYVGYSANYVVYEGSTPPTPPAAPSSLTAQAVSTSQIDLTWTDNADDETGFKIERCTGTGCSDFAQIATVGANVTSYSNTGLAAATSYSYRVRAYNGAGDSGYSSTATAVTLELPAPPAAPTNLAATAVSTSQINLAWVDNADDETGFKIERCTGAGCSNFGQMATVGANVTSYANTGLAAATSYSYRVRAYNAAGDSGYSNPASATTSGDTTPPAPPANLTATAMDSSVDLTWSANAEPDLAGYTVYRATSGGGPYSALTASLLSDPSYTDSSVSNGTTYYYVVTASDDSGNESGHSNEASATPQAQGSEDVAAADYATTYGSVAGTYVATQVQDNIYESITEQQSGGKPSLRHDRLEHIWRFDLTGGNHIFHVDAYYQEAGDADSGFDFSWSSSPTGPWTYLITVDKTADDDGYQAAELGSVLGTIYICVVDNDRTQGENSNDTLHVDHMYVDGGGPPTERPDPAANPEPADAATDVTTTPTLSWTAGIGAASHDVYFGTNPAPGSAEFKGNQPGTSFSPGTLNLNTTYYWRIDEVNSVGTTAGAVWSLTTRSSAEPQMYVFLIEMTGKTAGANRFATAVITIHDINGNPVSGATVYGTWSGDYAATVNGVTGADGTVSFTSSNVKLANASFTFTVDNVVLSGYVYDPSSNVETLDTIVVP
jgi:C1A family cysteine protease/fibronectin type 3 domain-containing protein